MAQDTLTALANQALSKLGHSEMVQSIDDDTQLASTLRQFTSQSIDEVQSEFPWQELVTRLEQLPTLDTDGRAFVPMPNDALRLLEVSINGYHIENNRIYAPHNPTEQPTVDNLTPWIISYTQRSLETAEWTPQLAQCFIYQLAINCAGWVSQDPVVSANLRQEYLNMVLPNARRIQTYNVRGRTFYKRQHRYNKRRWFGRGL